MIIDDSHTQNNQELVRLVEHKHWAVDFGGTLWRGRRIQ